MAFLRTKTMRRFGRTGLSICTCSTATLTPSTTLPPHHEPDAPARFMANTCSRECPSVPS